MLGVHDRVGEEVVLGQGGEEIGLPAVRRPSSRTTSIPRTRRPATLPQQRPQQPGGPQPDHGVEHAEDQRGPRQPQPRHAEDREQQRRHQRADVVEGQHPGDQFLEVEVVLEDPHQERQLQPHQHADGEHQAVEHDREETQPGEAQGTAAAPSSRPAGPRRTRPRRTPRQAAVDEPRKPGPRAHARTGRCRSPARTA